MPTLTLDLHTSTILLGTQPDRLLQFIQRENVPGVLFFEAQPQVSVFTLANLLNTTPEKLLEWLEDEALAELMDEIEDDEWYEGDAGQQVYQTLLDGNGGWLGEFVMPKRFTRNWRNFQKSRA